MTAHEATIAGLRGRVRTVAVTGTNGKTTTTSMVAAIVAAAGEPWARVTTLGMWVSGERVAEDGSMTSFLDTMQRAVAAGARTAAVETTSRSLAAGFARRWPPEVAVFTNLTRDHLDRHGSPEAYLAAKAQLFLALPPGGTAVLNADDPASALLDEVIAPEVVRRFYALEHDAELVADEVVVTREGTTVHLRPGALAEALGRTLRLRVLGRVHAHNALAASLACDAAGYDGEAIRRGLADFEGVPGRFQVVATAPLVVVDYAHSPDALERALGDCRRLAGQGNVWCVFGCGGDRDAGKRPEMGRVADLGADRVVLTDDNPRSEDPEAIADAVQAGGEGRATWARELSRGSAIALAIAGAAPADVVLIAGKGHETVQEVRGARIPFDDAAVARRALARRG